MPTYDLEDRTLKFAKDVRMFVKGLPVTVANREDGRQLIRSSGSVAANYIEANEALSKKDFIMRVRISRKEAKESRMWLNLVDVIGNARINAERERLINEATELIKMFSSILEKSGAKNWKNGTT